MVQIIDETSGKFSRLCIKFRAYDHGFRSTRSSYRNAMRRSTQNHCRRASPALRQLPSTPRRYPHRGRSTPRCNSHVPGKMVLMADLPTGNLGLRRPGSGTAFFQGPARPRPGARISVARSFKKIGTADPKTHVTEPHGAGGRRGPRPHIIIRRMGMAASTIRGTSRGGSPSSGRGRRP